MTAVLVARPQAPPAPRPASGARTVLVTVGLVAGLVVATQARPSGRRMDAPAGPLLAGPARTDAKDDS